MKREETTQKWTLELYQNRTKIVCILLAMLLSCVLAGLRAQLISTLPLLVLIPFACSLCFGNPLRILLLALPCGIAGGLFSGTLSGTLLFLLFSLLGAAFGVASAQLLRLALKQVQASFKVLLCAAALALLLIPSYTSFNLFGNPVSWISAAVRANSYVSEHYPGDGLSFEGIRYDSKKGAHNAVFSTEKESGLTEVLFSFDRKGAVSDGYQQALSDQFCREQAEFTNALLSSVQDSPLAVSASPSQPLGITRELLSQAYHTLGEDRDEARQNRREAMAKLDYTVSLGEFAAEPPILTKESLMDTALRFQTALAQQQAPYHEIILTAADSLGNTQRVRFTAASTQLDLEAGYRSYKPDEK